jgi:hypothetical protein
MEVDDHLYERFARAGTTNRSYVVVPGIAGTDEHPEIPEQRVSVDPRAYPVSLTLMLRQVNRFHESEDGRVSVVGFSQWAVSLNGRLVYCPVRQPRSTHAALVEAQAALSRLMVHPIQWWVEMSWFHRRVWYQGVPATIMAYSPERGQCSLVAEDGYSFLPSGFDLEKGSLETGEKVTALMIDILSPEVHWTRTLDPTAHGRVSAGTQDNAPVVDSLDNEAEGTDGNQDQRKRVRTRKSSDPSI